MAAILHVDVALCVPLVEERHVFCGLIAHATVYCKCQINDYSVGGCVLKKKDLRFVESTIQELVSVPRAEAALLHAHALGHML